MKKTNGKKGFILGATGATGAEVLKLLVDNKNYHQILAPTRSDLSLKHPKIQNLPFDSLFKPWDFKDQVDDFFYCFGSTQKGAGSHLAFEKLELKIARQALWLAKELKAKHFYLVSARGVDPLSSFVYFRVKAEVEKIIKNHSFMSCYIYRPSLLLTPRKEKRWGELVAQKVSSPIAKWWQRYWPKRAPVRVDQLARTLLYDATHPQSGFHLRDNKQILELSILYKE